MIEEKILLRRGRQPGRKQGDIAAVGATQLDIAQGPAASKTAPDGNWCSLPALGRALRQPSHCRKSCDDSTIRIIDGASTNYALRLIDGMHIR